MSAASFQRNDVACLPAPPFGQALDVLLGVMPLDFFHRPELHGVRPNERLDRNNDRVENADLPCISQPVQYGDDPILLRVEPLLGPDDDFRAFSHSFPQPDPAICGFEQRTSRKSGSRQNLRISWDVFAHSSQNRHASPRVTPTTRPNGHPPQRTPDPHALLRREFHSVSRVPNRANGSRASQSPPDPNARLLTLLRPS